MSGVTSKDIEQYNADGVVCLRGVFCDWVTTLSEATESALAEPGPNAESYGSDQRFFGDLDVWQRIAGFSDFVHQSPAAAIAAALMESAEVRFFYDQLLVKEAGASSRTPWHQDQPYWAVTGRQVCSIWVAMDEISRLSSLEFVRGSHQWEEHNPQHFQDGSPYQGTGLKNLPDIEAKRDEYDIVSFDLEAGDCLIFQAMIVHGARANESTRRRRAYSTRWIGDDARFAERKGEVAIPTFETGLADGEPFDGPAFPLVWTANQCS